MKRALVCAVFACSIFGRASAAPFDEEAQRVWFKDVRRVLPAVIRDYGDDLLENAEKQGIPLRLLVGILVTESVGKGGNVMQVTPDAQETTGIRCNINFPKCSIRVGAAYIAWLMNVKHLSEDEIPLAYNKGSSGAEDGPTTTLYTRRVSYVIFVFEKPIVE